MIKYKAIPKTNLEIASSGSSHNRVIFIRTSGKLEPVQMVEGARVALVGNPQPKLKRAFTSGLISRSILSDLVGMVSGNTYSKIRQFVL